MTTPDLISAWRRLGAVAVFALLALGLAPTGMAATIFVAKLNFNTTSDDLRQAFEAYGSVASAKVIADAQTGASSGYGFVEMPDDNEAASAVAALDGTDFDGRTIVVKRAEPRESSGGASRPGGGFGAPRPGTAAPTPAPAPAPPSPAADGKPDAAASSEADAEADADPEDADTASDSSDEAAADDNDAATGDVDAEDADTSADAEEADEEESLDAEDETDDSGE